MDYILKASLLLSLFYIFYKAFLQKQTFFQWIRVFFLAGILVATIAPLIKIPVYVTKNIIHTGVSSFPPISASSGQILTNTISSLSLTELFIIIYILGVVFMSIRFFVQFFSLYRLLVKAQHTKYSDYTLVQISKNVTAFSFFNYIVINEKMLGKKDRSYILQHEKIHLEQKHSIDTIIVQIMLIFQWFNPLAWLYKKSLEVNLEYIADNYVQIKSSDKKSYQMLLIKTAVPEYQMALANNFNTSLIKNRIIMLHKNPTKSTQKWKYILLLPVILLFMYAFNRVETPVYDEAFPLQMTVENILDLGVTITKDSDTNDLENVKEMFKQQGVNISIKKVKRNKNNEITGIAIKAKTEKSNTAFSADSEEPIHPIHIKFNAEHKSISINSNPHAEHDVMFISRDLPHQLKLIEIHEGDDLDIEMDMDVKSDEHHMIFIDEDGNKTTIDKDKNVFVVKEVHEDEDDKKNIYIEILDEDGDNDKRKKKTIIKKWKHKEGNDSDATIYITKDEDGETKIMVNGKKVTEKELEEMGSDGIKTIEIIKKKSHKK